MTEVNMETGEVIEPEPEQPAPEPDTEPEVPFEEPEPEPEPEAPPAGTVEPESKLDKERQRQLKQSRTTWLNAVKRILGPDADELVVCPLCAEGLPGHLSEAEITHPQNEMQERIYAALAGPPAIEYRDATQVRQCQDCGGWGKVKSGSQLAKHELVTCPACKGYGYTPPPVPTGNGYAEAANIPVTEGTPEEPLVDENLDIWGSPKLLPDGQENPNYGKMPQYKIPTLP